MNVVRLCAGAALVTASALAGAPPAAADTCPVMTFEYDPTQGATTLTPASVTVSAGGCVTFNNQTADFVQFAVDGTYRSTVGPFSETAGDSNYQATAAGTTQPVTATGATGQASGSIVIQGGAAPPPSSPAPPPSSAPPASSPASSSPPASSPTKPRPRKSNGKPVVVTPKAPPPPPVSPFVSKPVGSPPVVAGQTTPSPSPSSSRHPVVVAGPLQPPSGRGTGLPAAVAAIGIVGTAAALLRVLLAYPTSAVDSGRSVGATS